jgi:hypothetical protein
LLRDRGSPGNRTGGTRTPTGLSLPPQFFHCPHPLCQFSAEQPLPFLSPTPAKPKLTNLPLNLSAARNVLIAPIAARPRAPCPTPPFAFATTAAPSGSGLVHSVFEGSVMRAPPSSIPLTTEALHSALPRRPIRARHAAHGARGHCPPRFRDQTCSIVS